LNKKCSQFPKGFPLPSGAKNSFQFLVISLQKAEISLQKAEISLQKVVFSLQKVDFSNLQKSN
jgi:hypothetical protein